MPVFCGIMRRLSVAVLVAAAALLALGVRGQELVASWYIDWGGLDLNRASLAPDLSGHARHALRAGAGRAFQRALVYSPDAAGAYYNLGGICLAWDDPRSAAAAFAEAVALAPGDALAAFQWGQAEALLGREPAARAAWRQAGAAPYFLRQATESQNAQDFAGALLAAERALAVARAPVKEVAPAYLAQGRALEGLERYPEALVAYEAVAAPAREEAEARYQSALVLQRHLDRPVDALAALDRSLAADAAYAPALLERARYEVEGGECAAAALRLAPLLGPAASQANARQAGMRIGGCYLDQGYPALALPYLMQAVTVDNESVAATWLLARGYAAAGDPGAAEIACRRVLALQPDHAQALALLGEVSNP